MIANAVEYARRFVYFWQSTPVQGPFNEKAYPFVVSPLLSLDDIECKQTVLYGPTQSFKTVAMQIATAYRLHMRQKSMLCIAQTDDDAKDFAKIKMMPFLERIKPLMASLKSERSAKTIQQLLWAAHELVISGPGQNAQESKSVAYLHTDEAHCWNLMYPGAMSSLENRMGGRWDRHALHTTTAADAGTEIDIAYGKGQQDEWHLRCIHCNELIWPKWEDDAKKHYNGHRVFHWEDSQSESEMLDSIHIRCPHCDKAITDDFQNRVAMDDGAQYVAQNPTRDKMYRSYRWNAFAPRWKRWRDLLAKYQEALHAARLGNLEPYTNWVKKQEVRTNTGEYPMLGSSAGSRNYTLGEIEVVADEKRILSIDRQEGKQGEGVHFWALVDQWAKTGNSKRVDYQKLRSWDDLRAYQIKHGVKDEDVCIDWGNQGREVFFYCEKFHWLAMKSGDEESFAHIIANKHAQSTIIQLPYSATIPQSVSVGQLNPRLQFKIVNGVKILPPGFCVSKLWSKPAIYPMLYALKGGDTGREYGIASDINPDYVEQLHSYIPQLEVDKKTGSTRKTIWRKIKADDHSFVCSAQSLVKAMISGFYPTVDSVRVSRESTGGG